MSKVKVMAASVSPDEPCYGLYEDVMTMFMPDGSLQRRWVQRVCVIRGDRPAYYETDFGPAKEFDHVTPLAMWSMGDDTVAQLQAHAEKNRHDDFWFKRSQEMLAESTLVEDHLRQAEIVHRIKSNMSILGPGGSTQRNEFPQQAVARKLKDRRNDRRGYTTH